MLISFKGIPLTSLTDNDSSVRHALITLVKMQNVRFKVFIEQYCVSPDCSEEVHPFAFFLESAGTHCFGHQPLVMSQGVRISPGFVKNIASQVLFRPSEATLQPPWVVQATFKVGSNMGPLPHL